MRISNKIIGFLVSGISLLAVMACSGDETVISGFNDGDGQMVDLCINVCTSDISWPGTRSENVYPEDPAYDMEKMHTLRMIVVRPDNTVEANRKITLVAPGISHEYERIKVAANETKKVYLFVNETTVRETTGERLIGYSLDEIKEGGVFPEQPLRNLRITLEDDEQIAGPLPMTECHEVAVRNTDVETTLFVTRAAVKFSFHIVSKYPKALTVTGLKLHKTSDRMYYLPRNAVYADRVSETGREYKEIISFDTYSGTNDVVYKTYDIYKKAGLGTVQGDNVVEPETTFSIGPVYLLEGKYEDSASGGRNYGLTLAFDGKEFSAYFPNLPVLPRNTHADIYITIDNDRKITIMPLRGVDLDMDFGFDDLFPKDFK